MAMKIERWFGLILLFALGGALLDGSAPLKAGDAVSFCVSETTSVVTTSVVTASVVTASVVTASVEEAPVEEAPAEKVQAVILGKGVNISHWLSQSESRGEQRRAWFTRDDVAALASLGFDHLRIPVDEEQMFLENGKKDAEAFGLLHNALGWCMEFGLKAVVDLHILRSHHFNAEVKPLFTEIKAQERFYACWRLLSGELKRYPVNRVVYELMNEPVADDAETWNRIVLRCLEEVRKREPDRTVIIGSNRWQNFATVKDLRFPEGDKNLIISFHYYEPFMLTHYKASWTDNKNYTGPVHYPGLLATREELALLPREMQDKFGWITTQTNGFDKIAADFAKVAEVAEKWQLPVYCGEFGCIAQAPEKDRNAWYRDMGTLLQRFGFSYATWDYKGSFGIRRNGEWLWPVVEALTQQRGDSSVHPLSLYPGRHNYFQFRSKPTLLITSAEHYGLLMNRAMDPDIYLETLAKDQLNLTRVFSGAYVEPPGAFNIVNNTLAPGQGNFLSPWLRSGEPGYAGGGNKFDLSQWDPLYFERLHHIMQKASELGIVVELTLFCPMYDDSQWALSPMKAANNIQKTGNVSRNEVYRLDGDSLLLNVQERLVDKLVAELNGYDNLYFEICNEPYFGNVDMAWQHRITDRIVAVEKRLPKKHLISVNVANGSAKVEKPHVSWSILNFHYASPPAAVAQNSHLPCVVGMNETGFKGTGNDYYRTEAWEFMLAGGGLYNHLDYSFTAEKADGTAEVKNPTPGGGGAEYRKQMGFMKQFLESHPFVTMTPHYEPLRCIVEGVPEGVTPYLLTADRKAYALYLRKGSPVLMFDLPAGEYRVRTASPSRAEWLSDSTIQHSGGRLSVAIAMAVPGDIAVSIVALR